MASSSVCFTPRLSSIRPSPSACSFHAPIIRSFSTSLYHSSAVTGEFGCRKRGIGAWNIARGASILVSPLKAISYLPNQSSSSEKDDVITSPSPSLKLKSTESIGEATGLRTLEPSGRIILDPFRGRPGCVSFCGLNHQIIEARKLVSSPFEDGKGSLIWVVGPIALISSLLLPQFFLNSSVEAFLKNEVLIDIVTSFSSEVIFYAGLGVFLSITDHVQRPYIDFSPKQWSLITGLRGYLSSAFFTMGIKVVAPLVGLYVVWPIIALPAAVAVSPFLLGCAVQFAFELYLDKRQSSCWPLLPIIFEVYRLYQLSKGAHFLEKLIFSMKDAKMTPKVIERGDALVSMVILFQILAIVCLWSLTTFLLRLFPSRPVSENY